MNIIDALIILVIIMFGISGFKRGVIKQTVSTVGFVLVVILSFYLKNPIAEFLSLYLPFFEFGGAFVGVTALNILLYQLIAFILVLIILETILQALIKASGFIEKVLKFTIILGIPSKILGLIVGLIEGFIIVFIALFFLRQPAFNIELFDESKLTDKILNSTPVLSNIASGLVETFEDISKLEDNYQGVNINDNGLNLDAIDIMLKHDVITPKYVEKLVEADKINVTGIENVLNKYR